MAGMTRVERARRNLADADILLRACQDNLQALVDQDPLGERRGLVESARRRAARLRGEVVAIGCLLDTIEAAE